MKLPGATRAAGIASLMTWSAFAYYSFKRQFDDNKVINWELELASPNGLMGQGWKVDSLKPGDWIGASAHPAGDGSHVASARKVTLTAR